MDPARAKDGARFIAGDPLRGIACIAVLVFHTAVAGAQVLPPHVPSAGLRTELGWSGPFVVSTVLGFWFFFILSGYLLSGPFVRSVVQGSAERPRLGRYARNRFLRLAPAFWAVLTLTILVVGTRGSSLRQIVEFYGFAHVYDMGPLTPRMVQAWTLDVEVAFYIALPLVFVPLAYALRDRWSARARAAVILAGCVVVWAASVRMGVGGPASWRCVPGSAWAFAIGIALATLEPFVRPLLTGRRGVNAARALLALAALAYVAYALRLTHDAQWFLNAIAGVCCGSLLAGPLVLQWATGRSWRLLDNRVLHWFGERAYGLFLTHVLVIYELRHLTRSLGSLPASLLVVAPIALVTATALGALSYRFIERPFLERRVPWRPEAPASSPEPSPVLASEPAPALVQP